MFHKRDSFWPCDHPLHHGFVKQVVGADDQRTHPEIIAAWGLGKRTPTTKTPSSSILDIQTCIDGSFLQMVPNKSLTSHNRCPAWPMLAQNLSGVALAGNQRWLTNVPRVLTYLWALSNETTRYFGCGFSNYETYVSCIASLDRLW